MYLIDRGKLAKDIRMRRVIDLDITRNVAAKQIGITDEALAKFEKYTNSEIYVSALIKVCNWLGKNPREYFKGMDDIS